MRQQRSLELLWPKQPWLLLVQHWDLLVPVALGETGQLPERLWTGQEQWELPQRQALPEGLGSQELSQPRRDGRGLPQLELQGQGLWDRSWQQEHLEPVERLEHQALGLLVRQQDSQETSLVAPGGQPGSQVGRWPRPRPGAGGE